MNNMRTLLLVHVWINAGVVAVVNVNEIAYPSEQTPLLRISSTCLRELKVEYSLCWVACRLSCQFFDDRRTT